MKVWFQYAFNISVPPNDEATDVLRIEGDADFEVHKIIGIEDGDYTVLVQDTGTGRYFQNYPVHVDNFAGSVEMPHKIEPEPIIFRKNSTLQIKVKNLTSAVNNIQIVFEGYKIIS